MLNVLFSGCALSEGAFKVLVCSVRDASYEQRTHILLLLYGATHCDSARAVTPDQTVLVVLTMVGRGASFYRTPAIPHYTGYTIIIIHKYTHTFIYIYIYMIYTPCDVVRLFPGPACGLSAFRPLLQHWRGRVCETSFWLGWNTRNPMTRLEIFYVCTHPYVYYSKR